METYLIFAISSAIYSVVLTANYLPLRKENTTGLQVLWEQVKWFIWFVTTLLGPLAVWLHIDQKLHFDENERYYALGIWLAIFWLYPGLTAFIAWRQNKLKLYGRNGKLIYEGRQKTEKID